jgi:phosphoribosylglycinamide formyltransferase-1
MKSKYNLLILASGNGSNAENIVTYFRDHREISIKIIASNNASAYALERAKNLGVESFAFSKLELANIESIFYQKLKEYKINVIILAGFLLLIPKTLIDLFPGRIINIHPALLPKYGGRGMYGNHVHKAVIENQERESGITIHQVNSQYDEGTIIFQKDCEVKPNDKPEELAQRVHELEYKWYPKVIEQYLSDMTQ